MTEKKKLPLLERIKRWGVPGCGPITIPGCAPSGVRSKGIPSCVGRCHQCRGTGATSLAPWYFHWDGNLHPEMPEYGWGYWG